MRKRRCDVLGSNPLASARVARRASSACSKQRNTARKHAVEERIYYPFHPRCGETVLIIRRFAYRGTELVVIPQPDNSIACIPAWMVQETAAQCSLSVEPQFSLEVIRSLRAEVDALLSFLQPDSKVEEDSNHVPIRTSPTKFVRRGPAARRIGARTEDRVGDVGEGPAARDRDSAGKQGDRQ